MAVVVSSTQQEIVLGDPLALRVVLRGCAVGIALCAVFIISIGGGDWDEYYLRLAIVGGFLGTLAIWFAIFPAKVRRVISFNQPLGLLAVTSRVASPLGAWPFLVDTQWVRLRDALAGAVSQEWDNWQVTPQAVTQVRGYTVTVPSETGNSLGLYGGSDPNVALHILGRLRDAALVAPIPPSSDPLARAATVTRHRQLVGFSLLSFAVVLALPLLAFATVFRVFGDEPACPTGYENHGVISPDWETVVANGLEEDRDYVSCMQTMPAGTTACPPGDIPSVSYCWRPLLVPKFPLN